MNLFQDTKVNIAYEMLSTNYAVEIGDLVIPDLRTLFKCFVGSEIRNRQRNIIR